MWKFLVKNQSIEILEREVLADHQIQYVQFKFTFDGDWKKFHKVVQFSQCDKVYSIVLGFDGTTCYLPSELHVGAVKMSVFGYDAESDTTVRATTVPVTLNIRASGFEGEDDIPIPPTPDLYTQLLQKITEIQEGVDGKDGLSAYEIAKENSFVGTVSEWLESLKGADGLPGKDGIDGKDGITPDMSEYPKTAEVTTIIQQEIAPVVEDSHTHDNKSVLDSTTASYTTEEQQKLVEITPNDYATKEALEAEALSIREAMIPLTRELHSHQNMATLDALTPELMTEFGGLQQFEDRTVYEIQTLNEGLDNLSHRTHTHDNKAVLDETTASYTLEEQQKLTSINPSDYATKSDYPNTAAVELMIQKITYPLSLKSHEHENKATIDALTPKLFTDLQGLQQFEDSTIYEMQTFRESVEPVISQAHWHHNLTLLNSITAAKITKWDSFENFGTQINGLSTRITVYSDKVDSSVARIGTTELNIESLQKQIDALKSCRNYTTLFHYGQDAMSVYAPEIGIVLNGGYHLMTEFCDLNQNFCFAANDHAISYSQEDFNWDAQVLTVCTKELSLSESSKIVFSYQSGAAEDGNVYLVEKPQYSDVPVTIYVKDQIEAGRAVSLNFKWLQSDSFISTVTECGDITAGTYYLAWVGRSNNTHPIIRSVKVLEG